MTSVLNAGEARTLPKRTVTVLYLMLLVAYQTVKFQVNNKALQHHIFDGTYGWVVKESKSQPSINLRLSINTTDYTQLDLPTPLFKSSKVKIITDTGAQSSMMIKVFCKCGFDKY